MLVVGVVAVALSPLLAWLISDIAGWAFPVALLAALPILIVVGYFCVVSVSSFLAYRRSRKARDQARADAEREARETATSEAESEARDQATSGVESGVAGAGQNPVGGPVGDPENQNTAPGPKRPEDGV